ncbi:hypothetical protein U1Q18_014120, partial [Sarracenia purpurea var. burkii]
TGTPPLSAPSNPKTWDPKHLVLDIAEAFRELDRQSRVGRQSPPNVDWRSSLDQGIRVVFLQPGVTELQVSTRGLPSSTDQYNRIEQNPSHACTKATTWLWSAGSAYCVPLLPKTVGFGSDVSLKFHRQSSQGKGSLFSFSGRNPNKCL